MYFSEARLLPLDFVILSEKICEQFPIEEMQTYYIPRITTDKKVVNAKGKLVDKYRNVCRLYKNQAVVEVKCDDVNTMEDINGNIA